MLEKSKWAEAKENKIILSQMTMYLTSKGEFLLVQGQILPNHILEFEFGINHQQAKGIMIIF